MQVKITEVNSFAIAYRLFHEDFSLTLTVLVTTIDALQHFETG